MLDRTKRAKGIAALRLAGFEPAEITTALALLEDKGARTTESLPLLVNQATAARLISTSRFTVRRLVAEGRLKQIAVTPDCIRYSRAELEKLAGGEL